MIHINRLSRLTLKCTKVYKGVLSREYRNPMKTSDHTLEGVYDYKLDPKCRVSVPSDWRLAAGGGVLRLLRVSCFQKPVLKVLTVVAFENVLKNIDDQTDWTVAQKQMMRGRFFSECQKTKLNEQGKLLVPKALCAHPGLEPDGQVKLVGRGDYFEIVTPENYEEIRQCEEAELSGLNAVMGLF